MSDTQPTVTVYSDYVCPFCYLGRRSLRRYQGTRETELDVDWRPFDLRAGKRGPDGELDQSVDDGKDDEYYEQARRNVERLRDRYDADEMTVQIARDVDSLPAQLVSYAVKERLPDRWEEFDAAVFEALWHDGRDIGDEDVLVDVAGEAGIDAEEVRAALDDADLRARVETEFDRARREGVTGVPTFVYDGHAARGAVPPEQLKRLVEGV